jgi:hypothetical protein
MSRCLLAMAVLGSKLPLPFEIAERAAGLRLVGRSRSACELHYISSYCRNSCHFISRNVLHIQIIITLTDNSV